jgi:hypothetical protein
VPYRSTPQQQRTTIGDGVERQNLQNLPFVLFISNQNRKIEFYGEFVTAPVYSLTTLK